MKKLVSIALVLVLCFCFASSAFALTGRVNVSLDSWLNLRKYASTGSTIVAYIKPATIVTILDEANKTNGFYHIKGMSYKDHDTWTDGKVRAGYGAVQYID